MERISYQDLPEGLLKKLLDIEDFIKSSGLDYKLLELLKLRVSQINCCAYCIDMHHKELVNAGESDLRLYSVPVWQETPYFSEKERIALQFAEELTTLDINGVRNETFDELLKHFSKREISFLSLAVSQINTWTRLMRTFRFVPGQYKVQSPV